MRSFIYRSTSKSRSHAKKHYGVSHALQSDAIKDKYKKTCVEKYGVENPYAASAVKKKIANANLAKYGVENASSSAEVKEKRKATCIKRYGFSNPAKSDLVKQKTASTNIRVYGAASPLANADVKAKASQIKAKIKATSIARYGVDTVSKNELIANKIKSSLRHRHYESFVNALKAKGITLLSSKDDYIADKQLMLKCKCGHMWKNDSLYGNNYQHIFCKKCALDIRTSSVEKELVDYISSIYSGEIIENSRNVLKK